MASAADSDIVEAGALLGAALNGYGTAGSSINPPKGTHSSFSVLDPTPSSELMVRLHSLRSLLRSAPRDTPLVAAPSLLAGVLMKLLGISSNLAAGTTASATSISPADPTTRRTAIPPMLSTPLRKLWVDCVILCHVLGDGLSGNSRINIHGFVRQMIQLAAMNPRTARAAGGTRIAALEVIAGIMKDEKLAKQLSNWALDVIQLCQRALKSSGNGEPSYRIASIQTACAAAIASRSSFGSTRPGSHPLILKGALEDKSILEMVRLLKIATVDKYPEVRSAAAHLACLLAPLVLHTSIKSPNTPDAVAATPTTSLEDLMTVCFKNLDDESPMVAGGWAEALARCMSTSIEYHNLLSAEKTINRNVEGDDDDAPSNKKASGATGRGSRRGVVTAAACSSLPKSLQFLVTMFIKLGGELTPPRSGAGNFSVGGRAIRNGLARTMIELLRLQFSLDTVGEGKSISHKEAILTILSMVGGDMDAQLNTTPTGPVVAANNLFGQSPKVSPSDAGLARLAAARVLREGVSVLSPESVQISILHELIHICSKGQKSMTSHQLQVVLTEVSHLLAGLGEATASAVDELAPALKSCLRHPDQGVRHEAAVACAAMASIFPSRGRQLVHESIGEIQVAHAELMASSSNIQQAETKPEAPLAARFARFRRQPTPVKEMKVDESVKHKQAIHGMALMISIVLRDLPDLPGGLPIELLDKAVSVAEILVASFFNETLSNANPGGVCTCLRGGFAIFCGAFATGISGVTKHLTLVFGLWQKIAKGGQRGGKFADAHELVCVEAMLESAVAFLRYCSELLLSVPDALSRTTLLLEEVLPLLFPSGRLGKTQSIPAAVSHLDSAKAAILEAFAWLPPGSYPMVADSVFEFAAANIQYGIESEVSCSILRSLVSNEDVVLDATNFSRARCPGQVGGAQDLENDIIALKSQPASHSDRESVIHLLKNTKQMKKNDAEFRGSQVLGMIISENSMEKPPTPLHEVGTWRRPAMPSCSSKVRLVDASIQSFAATFTLKSGKEQQHALQILESLLPPSHLPTSRSALADQGRRGKQKDESAAAAANVAAVLLYCLQALPVFESTHNVPIHLGPMWMNKAKDVFLKLLRSPSQEVRRAAAEGLGFLSTLGVREDARFLQSAILHALDEVIQGTQEQGEQGKPMSIELISAGRSSAVLALACMQRTSYRIKKERSSRARERGQTDDDTEEILPLFHILIKILPSIAIRPTGGFLDVRAVGMHAFGLLFAYSNKLDGKTPTPQESHLLKKLIELVEDNFLSAWTAASADYDHGTDDEKLSSEASFVAVLLRLMTYMIPTISCLEGLDKEVAMRFSTMATLATECLGSHPTVKLEAMAFHEVLSQHQYLLPAHAGGVKYDEHAVLSCIPMLMDSISPRKLTVHPDDEGSRPKCGMSSQDTLRGALKVIRVLSLSKILVAEWSSMKIVSLLLAAFEDSIGTQKFPGNTLHRSLSAPRESELVYMSPDSTASELSQVMRLLVLLERDQSSNCQPILLRYILLSRCIVMGSAAASSHDDDDDNEEEQSFSVARVVQAALSRANSDAEPVLEHANPVHWQVKILAVQMMTIALREMAQRELSDDSTPNGTFSPREGRLQCAKDCREATAHGKSLPQSVLSLHIGVIVTAACGMATATVDQAELRCLQQSAMYLLCQAIECFGSVADPDQAGATVLNDDIPQISSAIKNALGAPSEDQGAASCRLLLAGCRALELFIKTKVTSDRGVLNRIFRPVVPEPDEVTLFGVDEKLPAGAINAARSKEHSNTRTNLLVHIGKLWTLGSVPNTDADLLALVNIDKAALGAHAASLAIDGARLLLNDGLTLCGTKAENGKSSKFAPAYLKDWQDIDESVKAALASTWSTLAASSVSFLTQAIESSREAEQAKSWLRRIVPFLFAGLSDSLRARSCTDLVQSRQEWARSVNPTKVASACLEGITVLSSKENILGLDESWKEKIEQALTGISSSIFEPIVSGKSKQTASENEMHLIKTSCSLLLNLTQNAPISATEESSVLLAILRPISLLESSQEVDLTGRQASLIIAACMSSVAKIVADPSAPAALVKAMVAVALKVSSGGKELTTDMKTAIRILMKACLSHEAITMKDKSEIAVSMAQSRDWETWSVVVQAQDGAAAKASLAIVQQSLLDCANDEAQLPVLTILRNLLQSTPPPNALTGRVVCSVLAEVLAVFQAYATMQVSPQVQSHRTAVCADGMKIALVAIQQFSADGNTPDNDVAQFLLVMFQTLIAVLRYNGLPNHPPPHPGSSDAALGRMCAQAITHVARTAPLPFKSSMGLMSEQDRTVLEFAVRAEMSGYAVAPTEAAPKKKLSLKGFKK